MRGMPVVLASVMVAATAIGAAALAQPDRQEDTGKAGLAKALAGLKPGKPMMCLPDYQNSHVSAYGKALIYTVTGSLKYVTHTDGGCASIAHGDVLVTKTIGSSPCSGDIATTIDSSSHFPTGSCSFGNFTEYRK